MGGSCNKVALCARALCTSARELCESHRAGPSSCVKCSAKRMHESGTSADVSGVRLLRSIILNAVPMILVQCTTQLILILTVMRLGRESPDWLAGASLGAL